MKAKDIITELEEIGWNLKGGIVIAPYETKEFIKDVRDIIEENKNNQLDNSNNYRNLSEKLRVEIEKLNQEIVDLKLWRTLARTKLLQDNGYVLKGEEWIKDEVNQPKCTIYAATVADGTSERWNKILNFQGISTK